MTKSLLIPAIIIVVALAMLYFLKTENKSDSSSNSTTEKSSIISKLSGKQIVQTLDSLGYFSYSEEKHLDTLKKEIETTYDKYKVLTTVSAENPPYQSYCYRYYSCDGETLFELDGITSYLKDIKPTFQKLGIQLAWSDDHFSSDATEHTIVINKKKYTAFKGNPNDLRVWGIATKYFVEILNDQLSIHNSSERVYPLLYGNDTHIVFLTKPQYDFIFTHFDEKEKPMEVNLWWKVGNQ